VYSAYYKRHISSKARFFQPSLTARTFYASLSGSTLNDGRALRPKPCVEAVARRAIRAVSGGQDRVRTLNCVLHLGRACPVRKMAHELCFVVPCCARLCVRLVPCDFGKVEFRLRRCTGAGSAKQRSSDCYDGVGAIDRNRSVVKEVRRRNDIGVDSVGNMEPNH